MYLLLISDLYWGLLPLFCRYNLSFAYHTRAALSRVFPPTCFTIMVSFLELGLQGFWVIRKDRAHTPVVCLLGGEHQETYRAARRLLQVFLKHVVVSL